MLDHPFLGHEETPLLIAAELLSNNSVKKRLLMQMTEPMRSIAKGTCSRPRLGAGCADDRRIAEKTTHVSAPVNLPLAEVAENEASGNSTGCDGQGGAALDGVDPRELLPGSLAY